MPYRIAMPAKVRKALDSMDAKTFLQVDKEIIRLKDDPRPHGSKKLEDDIYRVRSWDWRIIYAVFDSHKVVQLLRVIRRSERTYKSLP